MAFVSHLTEADHVDEDDIAPALVFAHVDEDDIAVAQFFNEKEDEIEHNVFCVEDFNSTSCKPRGQIVRSRV